jgi:hypothetical protein
MLEDGQHIEARQDIDSLQAKKQSCNDVKIILIKVEVHTSGLRVLNLHHEYHRAPVFEMSVGNSVFTYDMYYDHDIMNGDFSQVYMYDLTNYPQTYNP